MCYIAVGLAGRLVLLLKYGMDERGIAFRYPAEVHISLQQYTEWYFGPRGLLAKG